MRMRMNNNEMMSLAIDFRNIYLEQRNLCPGTKGSVQEELDTRAFRMFTKMLGLQWLSGDCLDLDLFLNSDVPSDELVYSLDNFIE